MNDYGVVLFHTTSSVMRAEKILMKEQFNIKLILTPRGLSSDCGVAMRFDWSKAEDVRAALDAARVEIQGIHQIQS